MILNRSLSWSMAEANSSFSISELASSFPSYARKMMNSTTITSGTSIRFIPWRRSKKSRMTLSKIYTCYKTYTYNRRLWWFMSSIYSHQNNCEYQSCNWKGNSQILYFSRSQVCLVLSSKLKYFRYYIRRSLMNVNCCYIEFERLLGANIFKMTNVPSSRYQKSDKTIGFCDIDLVGKSY